ncbi:hypothetical protein CEXT_301891 [Caerostris extrusa]|uniref:Uncharacterized protein n=1 Tax=Caerostris extrusa TaxID=172846 RepID=A0AAV4VWU0_CAEEX|nr:hypothetical protein CEXT_301891 [Caerostris extrusa]
MAIPPATNHFYPNHLTYHKRRLFISPVQHNFIPTSDKFQYSSFTVQHTTYDQHTIYPVQHTTCVNHLVFQYHIPHATNIPVIQYNIPHATTI